MSDPIKFPEPKGFIATKNELRSVAEDTKAILEAYGQAINTNAAIINLHRFLLEKFIPAGLLESACNEWHAAQLKLIEGKKRGRMSPALKPKELKIDYAFQEPQTRLFRYVTRNGHAYLQHIARYSLECGGIRSGKTSGALMYGVINYCLAFAHCDILVLRRTIPELDNGVIQDFKNFVPEELYDFNHTTRVAVFKENGSRVIFAGCATNVERDIEKYLGQAYPFILVDECAQFSADVWEKLSARNLVNGACEYDKFGNMPVPEMVGCTNPIGAHWSYYHSQFVLKEPAEKEEGARKAKDGSWWVPDAGEFRCVYDPRNYAFNKTTVLDNAAYLKRDPGIVARLKALPKAKMNKFLLGLMDRQEGQYFDCWSEEHHVIDLREDPEAIIWQDWQPVWGGQDWGMGHWNAFYFFTKALVRRTIGDDYVTKTVCFQEIAPETTGHTNIAFADMIAARAFYPRLPENHPLYQRISGRPVKVRAIYFSHEKFSRTMEAHSPADDYSKLLRARGLPPVSRGTMDRIGSASYMYNQLKTGKLVILKHCAGIIQAIPQLMRDPKELDDVLKTNTKPDDRYDGFRLGLYGEFKARGTPEIEAINEFEKTLNPLARYIHARKKKFELEQAKESFRQPEVPAWQAKLLQ